MIGTRRPSARPISAPACGARRASSCRTAEALEPRQLLAAAPVDVAMDSRFGTEAGYKVTGLPDVGPTSAETYDLAVLPSGKTLFAAGGGLARLTDAGVEDPTFGDSGRVASPWPGNAQFAWWNALLVT